MWHKLFGIQNIFLALTAIALLAGCSKKLTITDAPFETIVSDYIEERPSTFIVSIDIPHKWLADTLNKMFTGLLFSDTSYTAPTTDDVMIKVWKAGDIMTASKDDKFLSAVPLKIWAKVRYDACAICPVVEKETNFEATFYFATAINITNNYALNIATESKGYTWKVEPKINLGPVPINIKGTVENQLNKNMAATLRSLDDAIVKSINLKDIVGTLYQQLQQPLALDTATQTWLLLKPSEFIVGPIKGSFDKLSLNLGLTTQTQTYSGPMPTVQVDKGVPPLVITEKPTNTMAVNVQSTVSFAQASKLAMQNFAKQTYNLGRRSVMVDSVSVWGVGNKLGIMAKLSKDVVGTVYLIAKPTYNTQKRSIELVEVDFTAKSKNAVLKSASWLADGLFARRLQEALVFPIGVELDKAKASINSQLSNYTYQNLFTLKGNVSNLVLNGVKITPAGIHVSVAAVGDASIKMGINKQTPKR